MRDLTQALSHFFHYDHFRTGQEEMISDILAGKDVLGILPTGSGKSICYQLPAKLLDGITIVVSPLISLMVDQVKELKAKSFKDVLALNSFLPYPEHQRALKNLHRFRLIYVSPEWLQNHVHRSYLKQLPVKLFVIDEAHCISQWGHEFRPDYQRLHEVIAELGHPPVLALSATATPAVQADIMKSLKKPEMKKRIYPMDRKNIAFYMEKVENEQEKKERVYEITKAHHVPTLVYFTSRVAAEEMAQWLKGKYPERRVAYYHGGMEASERLRIQQQFMTNQIDMICCTSAFGMGINKADIRLVIHYHLPLQMESYIQEVGRAGRDGEQSVGCILYHQGDWRLSANMVKNELPAIEDVDRVFSMLVQNKANRQIFISSEEIAKIADLSEAASRFIYAQFKKFGLVQGNTWEIYPSKWSSVREEINQYLQERQAYKEKKLNELYQWLQSERCLRESLYQSFQEGFHKPDGQCCSNCGFSWDKWQPEKRIADMDTVQQKDWRKQLQFILNMEENSNEAT